MTELRKAREAERQSGQRKLFPVRLVDMETLRDWECFDADSGKDLATELREYFIPDFSHWKEHDPPKPALRNSAGGRDGAADSPSPPNPPDETRNPPARPRRSTAHARPRAAAE